MGAYLIWSNEHRAWWGPDRAGYYTGIASAGRYSRVEALTIARGARGGWQPGELPPEIAIPELDALRQAVPDDASWTRDDAPAVRASAGDQRCATCARWSQWLGETGDCLFHAYGRREAIITARGAEEGAAAKAAWPTKAARTTSAEEGCDGWERIETR